MIAEHGEIGRKSLSERLGVGEGSMRTILNQLKERGLITSSRAGHALTAKGKRVLGKPFKLVRINAGDITVGEFDIATLVRGAEGKVRYGIEQRDATIKVGAKGATVLVFKKGKLRFPDEFTVVSESVSRLIMDALEPREGDVVIIGTAGDLAKAEAGAKAAAKTLTESRYF